MKVINPSTKVAFYNKEDRAGIIYNVAMAILLYYCFRRGVPGWLIKVVY